MRVHVDPNVCQGYSNCISAAPDVFDLDASGLAMVLKAEVSEDEREAVRTAIRLCPVSAISADED